MECKQCGKQLDLHEIKERWDESASYYSTKIQYCPKCGQCLKIIRYANEVELDINSDIRYYTY